jgi:hypothetical protein
VLSDEYARAKLDIVHEARRRLVAETIVASAVSLVVLVGLLAIWYFSSGQIQAIEYARGMITLFFGAGTIIIALVLTLAVLFQGRMKSEERFKNAKDILTILIGVLGTIIGFYFGSFRGESERATAEAEVVGLGGVIRGTAVYLDGARVDDAALARLALLPRVERLYLDNTAFTDAGLKQLLKFDGLRYVSLTGTKVTKESLDGFEDQLKKEGRKVTVVRPEPPVAGGQTTQPSTMSPSGAPSQTKPATTPK